MGSLARGLMGPVVTLLVIGASHLAAEALRPELRELIGPAVVAPIYLAVGAWAGYATVRAGGGWLPGILAGTALGILPLALQVVGFGILLGRDADAVLTSGLFGLFGMTWGSAIGAGAAATMPGRAATRVGSPELDAARA
jgi:hypothetical protein